MYENFLFWKAPLRKKNLPPVIKSIQSAYEIARFEMHTPQQNFAQKGEGGDVLQTEMW